MMLVQKLCVLLGVLEWASLHEINGASLCMCGVWYGGGHCVVSTGMEAGVFESVRPHGLQRRAAAKTITTVRQPPTS